MSAFGRLRVGVGGERGARKDAPPGDARSVMNVAWAACRVGQARADAEAFLPARDYFQRGGQVS